MCSDKQARDCCGCDETDFYDIDEETIGANTDLVNLSFQLYRMVILGRWRNPAGKKWRLNTAKVGQQKHFG